jgi:hypothetical protein
MLNRAAGSFGTTSRSWIGSTPPIPPLRRTRSPLVEVNREHTVYLVEVEDENELAQWLERNHQKLFEGAERVVHGAGAVAAGPVAPDAAGVVFVRASHPRGGRR